MRRLRVVLEADLGANGIELREEGRVGGGAGRPVRRALREQEHRIPRRPLPSLGVERREERAKRGTPGPPQVAGQVLEGLELLGQGGGRSVGPERLALGGTKG